MGQPLEVHIRKLQEFYWSDEDPDGRGFVPLADALRKAGDFREAHRLVREGLGRLPDYASGHIVAAWLSVDQDHAAEAESSFRTALELDPRNISALRGVAEILQNRGEVDSALGLLEALLQEDPADLDLPERVAALRILADAPPDDAPETEAHSGSDSRVWEDPGAVAEELDWDSATLQGESSPAEAAERPEPVTPPPAVVEDGEPLPAQEDLEDALVTSTLGEIYLRQGLFGRAERVFETLLEGDPENQRLNHRLEEARALFEAQEKRSREVGGWGGERAPSGEDKGPSGEGIVAVESLAPHDVVAIESLAPGDGDSTIDSLDPDDGIAIDVPAPDEVVTVESLAPVHVVPIESLAPDRVRRAPAGGAVHDEPSSVDTMAADEPISIDALAPDEPISINALAPDDPISVDTLAPDGSDDQGFGTDSPDQDPGRDSTIDAFENWLEKLK